MSRLRAEILGGCGGCIAAFWLLVLLLRLGVRPDGLGFFVIGVVLGTLGMSAGATVWDRWHPSGSDPR